MKRSTIEQGLARKHYIWACGILSNLQSVLDHGQAGMQPAAATILRLQAGPTVRNLGARLKAIKFSHLGRWKRDVLCVGSSLESASSVHLYHAS